MDVIIWALPKKGEREKRADEVHPSACPSRAIEVEWATQIIPVSPPLFPFIST